MSDHLWVYDPLWNAAAVTFYILAIAGCGAAIGYTVSRWRKFMGKLFLVLIITAMVPVAIVVGSIILVIALIALWSVAIIFILVGEIYAGPHRHPI